MATGEGSSSVHVATGEGSKGGTEAATEVEHVVRPPGPTERDSHLIADAHAPLFGRRSRRDPVASRLGARETVDDMPRMLRRADGAAKLRGAMPCECLSSLVSGNRSLLQMFPAARSFHRSC